MASKITISKTKENIFSAPEIQLGSSDYTSLSIWWLGQAGFYLKFKNYSVLIDPYLSDFLAKKYNGKEFPHVRMMSTPVDPEQISQLDFVFCTHGHSDHMDPGTLPVLSKNNSACKFIVPKAEKTTAIERGVDATRILAVNAGESFKLNNDIRLDIISSAHEVLKVNEEGEHFFLGFIIAFNNFTLYHSGDCIPYPGLSDKLKNFNIDIALLPVNGRDYYRNEKGIPGNFTFDEATSLCSECKIPNLMVHHFGMFSFNSVDPVDLENKKKLIRADDLNVIVPEVQYRYQLVKK
jgi:L-ascorbate metabolism protein UlaG (beta-lactamase superfamily)